MKFLSQIYFKLTGWRVVNELPGEINKCVLVAAPHTSNWDFPITLAAFYIMEMRIKYLIKKEWMGFPLGWMFKATGGIGVDRERSGNFVDRLADILNRSEKMILVISPEGTRKLAGKWKTGFYYAAVKANVPIALAYLDYKKRIGCIGHVLHPTGDFIKDMQQVKEFYKTITPRHPSKFMGEIY